MRYCSFEKNVRWTLQNDRFITGTVLAQAHREAYKGAGAQITLDENSINSPIARQAGTKNKKRALVCALSMHASHNHVFFFCYRGNRGFDAASSSSLNVHRAGRKNPRLHLSPSDASSSILPQPTFRGGAATQNRTANRKETKRRDRYSGKVAAVGRKATPCPLHNALPAKSQPSPLLVHVASQAPPAKNIVESRTQQKN